ncbi:MULTISPECIES: UDP-glucose 4-epimerase GalE [Cytobacillus]|uniref:UDP-glucose 4-epimerase n=1 Tax=Cytobacillus oceanisediminis TaxID=665099 RepID=A0ABX3CKE0_9BACI|nr:MULTISPECIES: UDP-glucose 4-epimerase GalE [Cytobacillus]OHX40719.1 UDP-glucose 4-epimerase GalE [Cytobacillus oceanisediminis]
MEVLVTGGAGYIGSHTCVELLNRGYDVVVVDNFSNSQNESLNRVQEITGRSFKIYNVDLLNREGLEEVFHKNSIEAVIHFAGFKSVNSSIKKPLSYYHNNVTGSIILFETMIKFNVKKIVFSSSATVYGLPKIVPITEEAPLRATNPYGRTKIIIEEMLKDLYAADSNWSIVILRYFNPVGAHKSGNLGEHPNKKPSNLMPYISRVALNKFDKLLIYGNDYPTKDGTGIRDYIHINDLSIGHLKALEKIETQNGVSIYNLGTGKGYSVLDIIKEFERSSGKKIPFKFTKRRPGDIPICYASVEKASQELNWIANKDIKSICEDEWRWQVNISN